jgi:hypothetical protein
MEKLLNLVLFFQFFGSTCIICLILFYLALVRNLDINPTKSLNHTTSVGARTVNQ